MNNVTINELIELTKRIVKECGSDKDVMLNVGCGVEDYFNKIVWSVEKEEFDKMSFGVKYGFIEKLIKESTK